MKKQDLKLEKNQTVKKGEYYLFTGGGYSKGGWSGYTKLTIVKAVKDHYFTMPHWTNTDIFNIYVRTGKITFNQSLETSDYYENELEIEKNKKLNKF